MGGDSGGGRGAEDASDGGRGSDGRHEDRQSGNGEGTSTAQKAVMVASVAFTLLLFAYAGWQMATPPALDAPAVSVVGTERMADGGVAVTVRLRNPRDVGLVTATVQSNCTSPPVQAEFSYVPAASTRTGTLVCPPGTTDPSVSLANWVTR